MTDEIKLKPCPFVKCGGEGLRDAAHADAHWVECSLCNAKTLAFQTPEEAADFWNDRADDGPRFRVGDTVLVDGMGPGRRLERAWASYRVEGLNGSFSEERLEPAPAPLPEDHRDRHWVVGARLAHIADDNIYVVVSDQTVASFRTIDDDDPAGRWMRREAAPDTGWRFRNDSPIQTPKEP